MLELSLTFFEDYYCGRLAAKRHITGICRGSSTWFFEEMVGWRRLFSLGKTLFDATKTLRNAVEKLGRWANTFP